jgi:hypothetical protein
VRRESAYYLACPQWAELSVELWESVSEKTSWRQLMNRGSPALVHAVGIYTLGGADCYILLPTRYNLRASSHIWGFYIGGPAFLPAPVPRPLSSASSFKETKMNILTMILGLLVGLVAPILIGGTMAAAKIASIGRSALTIRKKALRKTTTTGARVGSTDVTVTKMPERKRDADIRPAA